MISSSLHSSAQPHCRPHRCRRLRHLVPLVLRPNRRLRLLQRRWNSYIPSLPSSELPKPPAPPESQPSAGTVSEREASAVSPSHQSTPAPVSAIPVAPPMSAFFLHVLLKLYVATVFAMIMMSATDNVQVAIKKGGTNYVGW
jgi:hypothetical protein